MIITVTGLLGSGKTTVANLLKRRGANVLHADEIGKWVLEKPARKAVLQYFGRHILKANGKIDTERLSDIVFGNRKHLLKLHEFTHPYIKRIIKRKLRVGAINVIDAALYTEFDLHTISDYTLLVKCPLQKKLRRLKGMHTKEDILRRIRAQTYLKNPDFVIDNSGSFENLDAQVGEIWHNLRSNG